MLGAGLAASRRESVAQQRGQADPGPRAWLKGLVAVACSGSALHVPGR